MAYNSDAIITGVTFHSDGGFDLTYAEQRDVTPNVVIFKQLSVAPGTVNTDEALEAVRELLDIALGKMVETPDTIELVSRKEP